VETKTRKLNKASRAGQPSKINSKSKIFYKNPNNDDNNNKIEKLSGKTIRQTRVHKFLFLPNHAENAGN
jgi:hypothetical protein